MFDIKHTIHRGWHRVTGPCFPGSWTKVFLGYFVEETPHSFRFEDGSGFVLTPRFSSPISGLNAVARHYNL